MFARYRSVQSMVRPVISIVMPLVNSMLADQAPNPFASPSAAANQEDPTLKTRFWVRRSLAVVFVTVIPCLGIWFFDSGFRQVYRQPLSDERTLIIQSRPSRDPAKPGSELRIIYRKPPGIGLYATAPQFLKVSNSTLKFDTVVDPDSGLRCVFDTNQAGFLFLYDPITDDLWDSTGRTGGLNASPREDWQLKLQAIIRKFPEIPYTDLP